MCDAQQKLLEHVDADAEAADEPAQLNNDETRDAEQTERTKRAWLKEGSRIKLVLQPGCDLHAPKPADWPVECSVYDQTAAELQALERNGDFVGILRAASRALRELKLKRKLTHKDHTEPNGASVIAAVFGFNACGTIQGCIIFQKRVFRLEKLDYNYGSSTETRHGLDKTIGAQFCVVCPIALVEDVNAELAEGSAFQAEIIATGLKYVCQCPPAGASDTDLEIWAPEPLAMVLANPKHDLYQYAVQRIAPPLTPPLISEERSEVIKEGLANMTQATKNRRDAGALKGSLKAGYVAGEAHLNCQAKAEVQARLGGYSAFVHVLEARECIQHNREPAPWAAGFLKPEVLERAREAGLWKDEFVTILPTEESRGYQIFCIEAFEILRPSHSKSTHVWDYIMRTQRGEFPAYDVAVGVGLWDEDERPPAIFMPSHAPDSVNSMIARALNWSPQRGRLRRHADHVDEPSDSDSDSDSSEDEPLASLLPAAAKHRAKCARAS